MKPQFIITSVTEKKSHYTPYRECNFNKAPASLSFDFEISVEGSGNFSDYLKDGVLNKEKILMDVLNGKISLDALDGGGE